jgi:nucleotide-binding universal stress UspA family protein
MKKIIYATDFSENSVAALKYAYHLGKLLNTDVIVLHVFDPDDLSQAHSAEERKQVLDHHTSRLRKFCSLNLNQNFEDLNLSLAVIKGEKISREILLYIKDIDVLMVILGACGAGTVREFFLGSTTKNMISASPVPLMAIPGNFEFGGIKRVIYTTDFEEEDIYHLCELIRILAPIEFKVTIVHVTTQQEGDANDLMEWFKELLFEKTSFPDFEFHILYSEDVLNSINECVEDLSADLLVMMERKSKLAVQSVLHRDLVKRMQSCTRVPLLSCKEMY